MSRRPNDESNRTPPRNKGKEIAPTRGHDDSRTPRRDSSRRNDDTDIEMSDASTRSSSRGRHSAPRARYSTRTYEDGFEAARRIFEPRIEEYNKQCYALGKKVNDLEAKIREQDLDIDTMMTLHRLPYKRGRRERSPEERATEPSMTDRRRGKQKRRRSPSVEVRHTTPPSRRSRSPIRGPPPARKSLASRMSVQENMRMVGENSSDLPVTAQEQTAGPSNVYRDTDERDSHVALSIPLPASQATTPSQGTTTTGALCPLLDLATQVPASNAPDEAFAHLVPSQHLLGPVRQTAFRRSHYRPNANSIHLINAWIRCHDYPLPERGWIEQATEADIALERWRCYHFLAQSTVEPNELRIDMSMRINRLRNPQNAATNPRGSVTHASAGRRRGGRGPRPSVRQPPHAIVPPDSSRPTELYAPPSRLPPPPSYSDVASGSASRHRVALQGPLVDTTDPHVDNSSQSRVPDTGHGWVNPGPTGWAEEFDIRYSPRPEGYNPRRNMFEGTDEDAPDSDPEPEERRWVVPTPRSARMRIPLPIGLEPIDDSFARLAHRGWMYLWSIAPTDHTLSREENRYLQECFWDAARRVFLEPRTYSDLTRNARRPNKRIHPIANQYSMELDSDGGRITMQSVAMFLAESGMNNEFLEWIRAVFQYYQGMPDGWHLGGYENPRPIPGRSEEHGPWNVPPVDQLRTTPRFVTSLRSTATPDTGRPTAPPTRRPNFRSQSQERRDRSRERRDEERRIEDDYGK